MVPTTHIDVNDLSQVWVLLAVFNNFWLYYFVQYMYKSDDNFSSICPIPVSIAFQNRVIMLQICISAYPIVIRGLLQTLILQIHLSFVLCYGHYSSLAPKIKNWTSLCVGRIHCPLCILKDYTMII